MKFMKKLNILFKNSVIFLPVFLLIINTGCRRKKSSQISKIDNSLTDLYFKEAQKQALNGNYARAEKNFLKSFNVLKNNPKPLVYLGYLYQMKGENTKSIMTFKRIIKLFPSTKYSKIANKKIKEILSNVKKDIE